MNQARQPGPPGAIDEWRRNWLLVLAAMAGISFGSLPSASLGLFMAPLQAEFGWTRAEISSGLTIFAVVSLPLVPFAGMMVDRFGARLVAITGIALSGLAFASFSLLGVLLLQWLATWFAYTLASLMTRTLVFSSAISRAFVSSRGLALAILLSGTAVASSLTPIATHWMIEGFGWRNAYLGLGLGWGGIVLVILLLFFREPGRSAGGAGSGSEGAAAAGAEIPGGMTVRQAVRSVTMLRIALAIFLQSTMSVAIMVHLVPLLVQGGLSRAEAAGIAAIMGIGSVSGKLVSGWLIDRFSGSLVPSLTFAGPALGYLCLLAEPQAAWLVPFGVFILGYCGGGCLQLATYLTTRYAGLANFGAIFGLVSSLLALSAGIGPLLAGLAFDVTGSYALLLTAAIPAALVAGAAVFGLGAYPDWQTKNPQA